MKSLMNRLILLPFIFFAGLSFAQDGEGLFKSKCNTCHMIGKNSIGPNLNGVKQKWDEAGELSMMYDWVRNPQGLIESGKSKMANEAKNFSESSMTGQTVSNEEIDAIFDYVDNYVPPVDPKVEGGEPEITYVPNYEKNLTLFYFLLLAIGVQLIAIFVLTNSTKSMVRMHQRKENKNSGTLKAIALTIGFLGLMASSNNIYALEFMQPGENPNGPWLKVENSDLYVLVAINIAMLFLVMHFRNLFMEIVEIVRPGAILKRASKREQRKVNDILTGAVPIEEEQAILLHHEYDGIKELDNNLPPWWVWGFYATIVFSIIYMFNYHVLGTGDLQVVEYEKAMAVAEAETAAYLEKMAMNVDENSATIMTEAKDLATGATLFEVNCISCHGEKGEGNEIGPNLTDNAWLYGYDIKEVFSSVKYGRPGGMPDHKDKLNPIQMQQVASFVLSLKEVNGKGPQGDIIEE